MRVLIKNVWLLTMNSQGETIPNGYLIVDDETIQALGPLSELTENEDQFDEVVDGKNGLLLPGMINTHTHTGMIPFRSLGDDQPDRLRKLLFPLEAYMTPALVRKSSLYAMAEMALSGISTFADMYYFMDEVAKSCDEIGMRGLIGQTLINQASCDAKTPQEAFELFEKLATKYQDNPLITPLLAPHAPNTNRKADLEKSVALAKKYQTQMMIHVSEMEYEQDYFAKEYQQTPTEFLADLGAFEVPFILVHGILLSKTDLALIKQMPNVKIAHCIAANTKSAKGVAPIKEALEAGITVGLGTDGPSSGNTLDMFSQMRLFANVHKTHYHDRSLFPAKEIVKLVTSEAAKVIGLADKIGSLEVGKQADLTLVETDSVNMFPLYDPYSALVYSANASNVASVWVAGKGVVRDKQLQTLDLEKLRAELTSEMSEFVTHIPVDSRFK